MEKSTQNKLPFIASACAFILYFFIGSRGLFPWGLSSGLLSVVKFPLILVGIACVITMFAKNKMPLTITLSALSITHFIIFLVLIWYMITDFDVIGFIFLLGVGIRFSTYALLTVLSIDQIKKNNSLDIIPIILEIVYIPMCIIFPTYGGIINLIIGEVILIVGTIFMCKIMRTKENISDNNTTDTITASTNDGYCDMLKHVLLLVFIGWIWQYVWIYKVTDYLNKTPNEEKRNPTNKLLLCMFVPFYYIYWIYQSARRIEILAKEKNIESDIVMLSTVLALFVGIIPPILMQNKINQICKCEDCKNTTTTIETNTVQQKVEINSDKTDEIRNYKKLLDDGIITEEEFEAKKKQLLGL